jgi:hypothetical protein
MKRATPRGAARDATELQVMAGVPSIAVKVLVVSLARLLRAACALAAVAAVVAAPSGHAAETSRPLPVARPLVSGPLSGGIHNRPFLGLLSVPSGFVQEEYLVSGRARPYAGPSALAERPVPAVERLPALPYTTRIIVVRPKDARDSNGTAVVTWQNVTLGHEIGEWFTVGQQVVREGYTYVEASVQLVSGPGLKAFDPVRYASINLPGDAYSYDIYSQVAKAVRHGDATGGRAQRHVLALGASQSGFALDQYLEFVQPRYERVYDGFLVAVASGPDHGIDRPVIRVLSENEMDANSPQPDGPLYRQWEVAGASHGSKSDFTYIGAQERRDLGADVVNQLAGDYSPAGLTDCLVNRFPMQHVYRAALVALRRWVVQHEPPAHQPRVTLADGAVARDAVGNAIGGIRLPAAAVPTAAYNRTGDCTALNGRTEPFTAQQLRSLYPTHAAYVTKVRAAAERSVRAGVLTPADSADVIAEARTAHIPR